MAYNEYNDVIQTMKQLYDKNIANYDHAFMLKTLAKRRSAIGCDSAAGYCRILERDPAEALVLFNALNISYSEFFRSPLTFALLEQWILPKLGREKPAGEIRVWSAGCAAGQEAYSIAMLLDMLDSPSGGAVRYRVIATDISPAALQTARMGEYDREGVQNIKLRHLQKYFTQKDDRYIISSRLQERISFSVYDLLDCSSANPSEGIYGDFDLVFCSNLLFYYTPEMQRFILGKMQKSMSANGYLVTGEAEKALVERNNGMKMIAPPAAIFQKEQR